MWNDSNSSPPCQSASKRRRTRSKRAWRSGSVWLMMILSEYLLMTVVTGFVSSRDSVRSQHVLKWPGRIKQPPRDNPRAAYPPLIGSSISSCLHLQEQSARSHPSVEGEEERTHQEKQQQINSIAMERQQYVRTFPRYRIDLTSPPSRDDSKNDWMRSLSRRLSWSAKTPRRPQNFDGIWVDSSSLSSNKEEQDANASVHAASVMTALWRAAANANALSPKSEDSSTDTVVVACPNVKPIVLQQWLDLYNWLVNLAAMKQDDKSTTKNHDTISRQQQYATATYSLLNNNVPTIAFVSPNAPRPISTTLDTTTTVSHTSSPRASPAYHHHETIRARTQAWVQRVLVQSKICPFTKSVHRSGQGLADVGVPVGKIAYHTSDAGWYGSYDGCDAKSMSIVHGLSNLQADTWEAVAAMLQAGPSGPDGVSSILLSAPHFDDKLNLWAGPVFCLLETGVLVAGVTEAIGVVCFHPRYATPDGRHFPGFGHMHSVPKLQRWMTEHNDSDGTPWTDVDVAAGGAWQRRTPHATINVLRAEQLAGAEGQRSTPELYRTNLRTLRATGWQALQEALDRERAMEVVVKDDDNDA